jgi:hypothetical protein
MVEDGGLFILLCFAILTENLGVWCVCKINFTSSLVEQKESSCAFVYNFYDKLEQIRTSWNQLVWLMRSECVGRILELLEVEVIHKTQKSATKLIKCEGCAHCFLRLLRLCAL